MLTAALLVGALTGCGGSPAPAMPSSSAPTTQARVTPARYPTIGPLASDIILVQMSLLRDQQTIRLAELALGKPGLRPEIHDLARSLTAPLPERDTRLRALLTEWKAPEAVASHSGHPMRGILQEAVIGALGELDGADFEAAWLTRLADQEQGAADLAKALQPKLEDQRSKDLVAAVTADSAANVTRLRALAGH